MGKYYNIKIYLMKTFEKHGVYVAPLVRQLSVRIEQGFAASEGFEQPEFGGEDNL